MADYFSHDYGARNDPKLVKLQMELGHEGKGLFWDLIEILYEQGGYIEITELNGIAFGLHTNYERITKVLSDFDLFVTDGQAWWSDSVLKRLELRAEKSEKARESVLKRWEKYKRNTNVKQTNNEGNTIKESKVKEIKESKGNKEELIFPFQSDEFMRVWDVLINTKKWRKKEFPALQASLKKLSGYTEKEAIQMMENSIAGEWQGLFELKKPPSDKQKPMAEIITNDKFKQLGAEQRQRQQDGRTN